MWGIPTIQKLNDEAAEAAEIMKAKGYEAPDFKAASAESVKNGRVETHTHTPLPDAPYWGEGLSPDERLAIVGGASN